MLVRWTEQDRRHLKALAREKRSILYIAKKLKRTELAIEKAGSNFGISLDMRDQGTVRLSLDVSLCSEVS